MHKIASRTEAVATTNPTGDSTDAIECNFGDTAHRAQPHMSIVGEMRYPSANSTPTITWVDVLNGYMPPEHSSQARRGGGSSAEGWSADPRPWLLTNFLHRYILDMRCDIPGIPERVLHSRAPIAVRLIGWFGDRSRARRQRPSVHGVAIRHIHIKHCRHRRIFPVRLA